MQNAFNEQKEKIIEMTITKKVTRVIFIFQDNGSGIQDMSSVEESTGFGIKLVIMMAKQLNACMATEKNNGTRFTIEFGGI